MGRRTDVTRDWRQGPESERTELWQREKQHQARENRHHRITTSNAGTNGLQCRLTKQRLQSGSVEVAGTNICRGLDYGTDCSWWGSALTPIHISTHTIRYTHTQRERERALGEWRQIRETQDEK
jgi:hypothetical protein